jgi:hypothetical protein
MGSEIPSLDWAKAAIGPTALAPSTPRPSPNSLRRSIMVRFPGLTSRDPEGWIAALGDPHASTKTPESFRIGHNLSKSWGPKS